MTESYQMFPAVVTTVEQLTPLIKRFTFKRQDGLDFPAFTGGSHIIVKMNDKLSNAYSLMSNPKDLSTYQVCVRKDAEGKGGSIFMHDQCLKDFQLEISSPKNLFELSPHGEKHILIAGGIGITPFIQQMDELKQSQHGDKVFSYIEVMADQSILQAIESLNIDVECLCREGVCGTCETAILQGEAEHYDQYFSDDEKASQQSMMIYVSRAKGKEITLNL